MIMIVTIFIEVADITKCGFQTGPLKLQKIQGKLITIYVYLNYYNICMPKNYKES